jgi:transposase
MGAVAFAQSGGKVLTPEEENKALREELAVTRRERDILKKALAIFSKEPQSQSR